MAVAAAAMVAGGIVTAAPASAGCETQTYAQYCDGPIQPDGNFQRCQVTAAQPFYTGSIWTGVVPSTQRCYQVDPRQPWPMFPLGQPQRHLWP